MPDAVPEGAVEPPPLDTAWAESTRKKALLKLEKLDTDLKNYKGNSIKESIRYVPDLVTWQLLPLHERHEMQLLKKGLAILFEINMDGFDDVAPGGVVVG